MLKHPSLLGYVWFMLSEGGWVSGERVAEELGVSKVAVWKAVERLKGLGYKIEAEKGKGYRLLGEPNLPHPWRVAKGLNANRIGSYIIFIGRVKSTQDEIKRAQEEGTVVIAGRQTGGRGRLGRAWLSTEDDLKLSVLLKPLTVPPHRMGLISLMAGLAVCRAVGGRLKWPNDVLLGGKKAAGILVEGEAQQDRLERVYVGVGINVNSSRGFEGFEATSLKLHYSREFDLAGVAAKVLSSLDALYGRLLKGEDLIEEIRGSMDTLGRRVKVISFDEEFEGIARDIDEDGSLLVEVDGKVKRVSVGDVVHLRA